MNRTIVGSTAHTVSMGGYTLGGGHSPIGRKFGLAIDNLLEVEIVTANGTLVYATEAETTVVDPVTGEKNSIADGDLFWALRGGGGGTFGIVTGFTFKLHPDSPVASVNCYTPLTDLQLLVDFNDLLSTSLAPEWGGHVLISPGGPLPFAGMAVIDLIHYGPVDSPSYKTIDGFLNKHSGSCSTKNLDSFMDYEKDADPGDTQTLTYVFNTLVQSTGFTQEFYDFALKLVTGDHSGLPVAAMCLGTLIGGLVFPSIC